MGMYPLHPEIIRYMQQTNEFLRYQNQQIQQMNLKIQELEKEINSLKTKEPPQPVIRNEYRFDLLKVEKLEGTLNIGLNSTPADNDGSIEQFAVGQSLSVPGSGSSPSSVSGSGSGPEDPQQQPQMFQDIQDQVKGYLNSDAYRTLEAIEQQYQYPLDDPYRKFIVDDVQKQIDQRIRYYLQKQAEQPDATPESIIEDVKKDIEKTFEAFIKNLPKKENGQQ
jgi:spore germination protein PC